MSRFLVVNGDDFGMCHSVNTGIVQCFTEGILTQASLMAPCPWFEEACALAESYRIPVGVHLTVTCDFDMMKWRPLTTGRSIADRDGCFYGTIEELNKHADPGELRAELEAQIKAVCNKGLDPVYLESHVGIPDRRTVAEICRTYGLTSSNPLEPLGSEFSDCMVMYDSFCGEYLADLPVETMKSRVARYIRGLDNGLHFIAGNPAVPGEEMRCVCSDRMSERKRNWAEPFRASFLELFTSQEIVDLCRDCGVLLVPLEDVPKRGV